MLRVLREERKGQEKCKIQIHSADKARRNLGKWQKRVQK
jgi:hypothetical protein